MLETEKPDAVVMAVPPPLTGATAALVLARGFPLLLEKPPGLTVAELDRLIAAAEAGRVRAQVAFNRHYMPVMRKARELLDAEFPAPDVSRVDYVMTRFDRWDPDFSTTAVHAVDGALFLAPGSFRTAEIHFQPQRSGDRETANITVEAECATGARVVVTIQPVSGVNADAAVVHALGQMVIIKIPVSPQSSADGSLEHWRGDKLVASFSDSGCDAVEKLGVFGETEAFLNAVGSGADLAPGLKDCHQQVALMEAIRLRRSGLIQFEV
jgi:predicted dehydrogenase